MRTFSRAKLPLDTHHHRRPPQRRRPNRTSRRHADAPVITCDLSDDLPVTDAERILVASLFSDIIERILADES